MINNSASAAFIALILISTTGCTHVQRNRHHNDRFITYVQYMIKNRPTDVNTVFAELRNLGVLKRQPEAARKSTFIRELPTQTIVKPQTAFVFSPKFTVKEMAFGYANKELVNFLVIFQTSSHKCVLIRDIQRRFGKFGKPYALVDETTNWGRTRHTDSGKYIINVRIPQNSEQVGKTCVTSFAAEF